MVQTFSSNRPYQPLDVSVLPGGLRRREDFSNTQPVCGFAKSLSVAPIPIPQQETGRAVPGKIATPAENYSRYS
jgi:hypothetical protein